MTATPEIGVVAREPSSVASAGSTRVTMRVFIRVASSIKERLLRKSIGARLIHAAQRYS